MLTAQQLVVGFPQRTLVHNLSFSLEKGEAIAVLGANGCGKTTLFRTLLGLQPPLAGTVSLSTANGLQPLSHFDPEVRARQIAYVPQSSSHAVDFSVLEMVEMARTAQRAWYATADDNTRERAMAALEIVGISALNARRYNTLSGGERQLVLIARALATGATTILLDEPTASLDFANQFRIFDTITALKRQRYSVLFSTHQPEQARLLAARTLAIQRDGSTTIAATASLLTRPFIAALYGINESVLNRIKEESAI
jgi:iron complex transport system ATP-binding protein